MEEAHRILTDEAPEKAKKRCSGNSRVSTPNRERFTALSIERDDMNSCFRTVLPLQHSPTPSKQGLPGLEIKAHDLEGSMHQLAT
jgi:hypothetical protein